VGPIKLQIEDWGASRACARVHPPRFAGRDKKEAGEAGLNIGGLNRVQNRTRSAQTPGGWGAEESGALADRALEGFLLAILSGVRWAQMGPHYGFH